MSEYTQLLAQLTEEEQRIYGKDFRMPSDFRRLANIQAARELIWNLERARRAGLPESSVPVQGWRCDRIGFVFPRPRKERGMHYREREPAETAPAPDTLPVRGSRGGARGGPRDLPLGVQRTRNGRVQAIVAFTHEKRISLGTFADTPEQIALADRMVTAAREARDAGASEGECRAAALAIWQAAQQETHAYAAD